MKVYYGNKGSEFFIMCMETKEIYVFDMFGTLCRVNGTIDSCNNWQEVDFLSFVSTGVNSCELLYNGYTTSLNTPILEAIKPYRLVGNYMGTIFNVPHEDSEGRFSQLLMVFKKGVITNRIIISQYPNNYWNKLIIS